MADTINRDDFPKGTRIVSLVDFSGVPKGTEGVIDEHYTLAGHRGAMVAWDLPNQRLPEGYREHDGKPAAMCPYLRDGFDEDELKYLQKVSS